MTTRPEDLMAGYLLGELFADERVRIEAIMGTGAVTSPEEGSALATVHSVALYTIPTKPSPRVRENLMASLTGYVNYVVANNTGYRSLVKAAAGSNDTLRAIYDTTFAALSRHLSRQQVIEFCALAGNYDAIAGILAALRVPMDYPD